MTTPDADVFARINALAHEEEELYGRASDGSGLRNEDVERLATIKVELDQCYDLLHQRQGRRDAGEDPREAELRPPSIVEGYEQ